MSVVLFGAAWSVYVRIARLALEEKGVAYTLDEVDVFAPGGAPPEHLARHPFGRIPAFAHDGFALYETAAICRYVDEAFDGPALLPDTARARARAGQIVGLLDAYGYRAMVWDVYVELAGDAAREGRTDRERVADGLRRSALVLDELVRLAGQGPFLTGTAPGLADLHAAPMLAYFMATPEGRAAVLERPLLTAWADVMARRPSVVGTRPPEAPW